MVPPRSPDAAEAADSRSGQSPVRRSFCVLGEIGGLILDEATGLTDRTPRGLDEKLAEATQIGSRGAQFVRSKVVPFRARLGHCQVDRLCRRSKPVTDAVDYLAQYSPRRGLVLRRADRLVDHRFRNIAERLACLVDRRGRLAHRVGNLGSHIATVGDDRPDPFRECRLPLAPCCKLL